MPHKQISWFEPNMIKLLEKEHQERESRLRRQQIRQTNTTTIPRMLIYYPVIPLDTNPIKYTNRKGTIILKKNHKKNAFDSDNQCDAYDCPFCIGFMETGWATTEWMEMGYFAE